MNDVHDNPMGTDGLEFVEYTAPDPQLLRTLFERLGFPVVARHRSKNVTLHRQGEINFIINAEPQSLAQAFARQHGPSACAMAFRVRDAAAAFRRVLELGAKPGPQSAGPMELNIPCIEGIGGSLIYLVHLYGERSIYEGDFLPPRAAEGGAAKCPGRVAHPKRHGAGRRTVRPRKGLRKGLRFRVDDEVDLTLTVQRDVLGAMARHRREPQPLEQRAQQLRIGCRVLDELEAIRAHGIVMRVAHQFTSRSPRLAGTLNPIRRISSENFGSPRRLSRSGSELSSIRSGLPSWYARSSHLSARSLSQHAAWILTMLYGTT